MRPSSRSTSTAATSRSRPLPGIAWSVAGDAKDGRGPRIEAEADRLAIDPTEGGGLFGIFSTRSNWRVTLPTDPVTDLELDANAGTASVDLAGARMGLVDIGLNAGSATVDLGAVAGDPRAPDAN